MPSSQWFSVLACVGHLTLALLCLVRAARSPLAQPLGLLSITMLVWNFAQLAYAASGDVGWRYLEATFSPLSSPFVLHFILNFVGRRRQLGWALLLTYGVMFTVSLCAALALFDVAWAREFSGSAVWSAVHLTGLLPVCAVSGALLLSHLRSAHDRPERARTLLLLLALGVAGPLACIELTNDWGWPTPRLANVGTFGSSSVMALVTLRYSLFEAELSRRAMRNAALLALGSALAYLATFRVFGADHALLAFGTVAVTVASLVAARGLFGSVAERRERVRHLATLGRMSAQMAHDLKNPLAALRGAAQFLAEEVERGRSLETQKEFLQLILEQCDRVQSVVGQYQRLGRVDAQRAAQDVNALVREVLAGQRVAARAHVAVRAELDPALPRVALDRELFQTALENLVRNAFEALPERGGEVVVRTERGARGVTVSVADNGAGMSARVAERAFDDFFTTKASGSGLGLALVRRVVEAHEGRVELVSAEGAGTTVRLELPAAA